MTQSTAPRRVRVLLIEDNPADVDLLRRAFSAAHFDCDLMLLEDGAEALEFIRHLESDDAVTAPDLAVLDWNLPKNDGLEVLQAMRDCAAFAAVPVAVLSSSASGSERERIEAMGIGRYITKPPDLDQFLEIGRVLRDLVPFRQA
jgi:DNA-binding response OmpR family regulator